MGEGFSTASLRTCIEDLIPIDETSSFNAFDSRSRIKVRSKARQTINLKVSLFENQTLQAIRTKLRYIERQYFLRCDPNRQTKMYRLFASLSLGQFVSN